MTTTLLPDTAATDTHDAAPRVGRLRRWIGPIGIGLVNVLLAAVVLALPAGTGRGIVRSHSPAGSAVSPAAVSSGSAAGASGPLIAVADLIEAAPTDASSGRYTYVELSHFSRRDGTEIVAFHERRWRADDGSGRVIIRQLPAVPARSFGLSQIPGTDFTKATVQVQQFGPGEMTWGIHGPVPTTPAGMAAALQGGFPGQTPPEVQIDFFIGLFQWDYLGRDSRAAALRALAVVDGLVYEGETTDQAGRAGIGVSQTTAGVRQLLIINPRTGELLASERSVPGFVIDDYTIYLAHDRRPNLT